MKNWYSDLKVGNIFINEEKEYEVVNITTSYLIIKDLSINKIIKLHRWKQIDMYFGKPTINIIK